MGAILLMLPLAAVFAFPSLMFIPRFYDLVISPIVNTLIFSIFGKEIKAHLLTRIRFKKAPVSDDGDSVFGGRMECYINYEFLDPKNANKLIHVQNERFHRLTMEDINKIKAKLTLKYYYNFIGQLKVHSAIGMRVYFPCDICSIFFLLLSFCWIFIFPIALWRNTDREDLEEYHSWNYCILFALLAYLICVLMYGCLIYLAYLLSFVCDVGVNNDMKNKYNYRQFAEDINNPLPICTCRQKLVKIKAREQMNFNACKWKWQDQVYCNKCGYIADMNEFVYHCYHIDEGNNGFNNLHTYNLCSNCV